MSIENINNEFLQELFPAGKDDEFFEALYGGAEAGAFDITLHTKGFDERSGVMQLEFRLTERPGMCMACNLTYGLPEVFTRHPVINASGIADAVAKELSPEWKIKGWRLGGTITLSPVENSIPFILEFERQ